MFINYGWYAQEGKEKEELWIQLYPCIAQVRSKAKGMYALAIFIFFAGTRRDKAHTEGYLLPKKILTAVHNVPTCVSTRENQSFVKCCSNDNGYSNEAYTLEYY